MKRLSFALGLSLLAASASAQEYKEGLSGPAADMIDRYIEQTKIDCYKPECGTKCRIAETALQRASSTARSSTARRSTRSPS